MKWTKMNRADFTGADVWTSGQYRIVKTSLDKEGKQPVYQCFEGREQIAEEATLESAKATCGGIRRLESMFRF